MGIVGTMIIVGLLLPVTLFAQGTQAEFPSELKGFCAKINEITSRIDQRIAEKETKLKIKWQQRANNLESRRASRDMQRVENRASRDTSYEERYKKLEARATTESQKQAVAVFKAASESAIIARKSAIDTAINTFKQSTDQTIASRKSAIDTAINTFKTAKMAAFEKAKADCAAGIDGKITRETLRSSMKSAQEKFKSDRQAIEKIKDSLELVRQDKKQIFEKAISDFKLEMEKARNDLKTVF